MPLKQTNNLPVVHSIGNAQWGTHVCIYVHVFMCMYKCVYLSQCVCICVLNVCLCMHQVTHSSLHTHTHTGQFSSPIYMRPHTSATFLALWRPTATVPQNVLSPYTFWKLHWFSSPYICTLSNIYTNISRGFPHTLIHPPFHKLTLFKMCLFVLPGSADCGHEKTRILAIHCLSPLRHSSCVCITWHVWGSLCSTQD